MYTIKYEEYHSDFLRKTCERKFSSLTQLEDWIFDQMQQKYDRMWFPKSEPGRIEFTPKYGGPSYWIYLIESQRGIEFTDGRFTNGQKHWSSDIQSWLKHCNNRKTAPTFVFAD